MIKAFAPRKSGGYSRVLLSIALTATFPLAARSQQTTKKESAPAAEAPAAGANAPADAAKKGDQAAAAPEPLTPQAETFRDPRAENCLEVKFPVLGKRGRTSDRNQVNAMAANQAGVDRDTIERFVATCMNELTDHTNIKAVIDPQANILPTSPSQFAIKEATDDLVEPILSARGANNSGFLNTYTQVLLQRLPPLLDNHLLARIAGILVLSQTGSPEAVDIFVKQITNREQTLWVEVWAFRGLTNVQQLTRYNLDAARAIRASKAVSEFLKDEKDIPWFVQYRALEALGSLRLANTPQMQRGQPEMASTAAEYLTEPERRLEVRAEAGWALSMMVVPAGISGYNYTLIGYSMGEIAAQLGDRIREVYPKNANQAEALAGVLVIQVLQSFDGIDAARDSGLLKSPHPAAAQARPFLTQVSAKAKPLAASAVRLVKEPQGRAAINLKDLEAKLADLKALLQKNPPANTWLVPNGPKYPVGGAQVANAQAGAPQVVSGPAGRPAR